MSSNNNTGYQILALQSKLRELIWKSFSSSYDDARRYIQNMQKQNENDTLEEEGEDNNANNIDNVEVIKVFVENLRAISSRQSNDWIDYQMHKIRDQVPIIEDLYQDIIWSLVRFKFIEKNNLISFREKDWIVPFQTWFREIYYISTLKFLDIPSLFDEYLKPRIRMVYTVKAKKLIDTSIAESLCTCIDWKKLSNIKSCVNMESVAVSPAASMMHTSSPSSPSSQSSSLKYSNTSNTPHHRNSSSKYSDDRIVDFGSSSSSRKDVASLTTSSTPPPSSSSANNHNHLIAINKQLEDLSRKLHSESEHRARIMTKIDERFSNFKSQMHNIHSKLEDESKNKSDMRRELEETKEFVRDKIVNFTLNYHNQPQRKSTSSSSSPPSTITSLRTSPTISTFPPSNSSSSSSSSTTSLSSSSSSSGMLTSLAPLTSSSTVRKHEPNKIGVGKISGGSSNGNSDDDDDIDINTQLIKENKQQQKSNKNLSSSLSSGLPIIGYDEKSKAPLTSISPSLLNDHNNHHRTSNTNGGNNNILDLDLMSLKEDNEQSKRSIPYEDPKMLKDESRNQRNDAITHSL